MSAPAGSVGERKHPVPVTIVAHDVGSVGGMERQIAELAVRLRRRGHEVTVVARKCVLPPGSGVSFRRVRGPGRPFLIAYPWFLLAGSLALRRHRSGIVQSTGSIVLNPVDTVAVHYCHCAYSAAPARPGRLYALYDWAVGVVERRSERLYIRRNRSAELVCVSEGVAEEVRSCFPGAASRVVTIHNGVDVEEFAPGVAHAEGEALRAQLELEPGALLAAFVGGDWERKGLGPSIAALAQAPEWHLAIAGKGPQRPYDQLAASLGVSERVHWLGVRGDVRPLYAAADAFVLPTSYETFSLVTFEAAASGLPVIAGDVNGVRELIRSGQNGYLIETTADQVASRLRELGADPALRASFGAAAREAASHFTWERMVAAHEQLFERLAAARG